MSWVAVAVGGSAVLSYASAKEQSKAATSAANTQVAGGDRATEAQLQMYETSRADLAPWRAVGERSLADLEKEQTNYASVVKDPNLYKQSPGYGWLQKQGIDALNRGASASGKLDSGQRSKDLISYGQGLALQDYTGYLGRLESLMNRYAGTSQVGQSATNTTTNLGSNVATNIGNINQNQANAVASGQINQANARTGLYQNLANIGTNWANQYTLNNTLQQMGRN